MMFAMISCLFSRKEHCEIPEVDDLALPPPFVFRTIFIYGRSNCELRISPECMKVCLAKSLAVATKKLI